MRKIYSIGNLPLLLAAVLSLVAVSRLNAQGKQEYIREVRAGSLPAHVEASPEVMNGSVRYRPTPPSHMWKVQFDYNASTAAGNIGGMAGVALIGTELWVSKWNSDSILRFTTAGAFLSAFSVPAAYSATTGGIRALTYDGSVVYAANNTSTIHKINPVSRTVVGTITAPALTGGGSTGVRHLSYDATANAGTGGLWIGNWDTDLKLISLTGSVLNTITAANHTLTGMYGSSFDNSTPGGPYLWIFDQNTTFSATSIVQIKVSTGTPTGVFHDVLTDVAPGVDGLAGGLYFAPNSFVAGENTLIGIVQGSTLAGAAANHLFGYQIKMSQTIDAAMQIGINGFALTQIPKDQVGAMNFGGRIWNYGMTGITTATMNVNVKQGGSSVFTDNASGACASNDNLDNFTTNTYTPTITTPGTVYNTTFLATTGAQVDSFPGNDSLVMNFTITDSTFAHDDGNFATTGYRSGAEGYIVTVFPAANADQVTSVWVDFMNEFPGETLHAAVFGVDGNGNVAYPPLATSNDIVTDGTPGAVNFLFPGGVSIQAGDFAVGVYEAPAPGGNNIPTSIKQSYNSVIGGMNYVYNISTATMSPSSISTARAIRANFGTAIPIGVDKGRQDYASLSVFPNPGNGNFTMNLKLDRERNFSWSVTNSLGEVVIAPVSGKGKEVMQGIDLTSMKAGVYFLHVDGDGFSNTSKLMLVK